MLIPHLRQALIVGSNFRQTVKILSTILTFILFPSAFGQEIPKKVGCIEIKKVNHYFLQNKEHEQTKKITNKANRPHLLLYLDTLGNVVEKVGYGKHHNTDLRLLDFVEQNEFENGRLANSIKYNTDYEKNISANYKTKYFYNKNNQLIQEKELYYKNDSLFMQFDYEYDSNGNKIKTIFNSTYYYQRFFDNQSKIKSLQQVYDNKLRWEWTSTYTDTTRIGIFKTYYNDGKDYSKQEIRKYQDGKIIEVEEKYISQDGLSSKTIIHYNKLGIIARIEVFECYSNTSNYQIKTYTDITIKVCSRLTPALIEKINETIYAD